MGFRTKVDYLIHFENHLEHFHFDIVLVPGQIRINGDERKGKFRDFVSHGCQLFSISIRQTLKSWGGWEGDQCAW